MRPRSGRITTALHQAALEAGCPVYLGSAEGSWAWAEPERPTLVLGPTRSGKTSCIIIPNVLAAPGAVVSTSTKGDVMRSTAGARSTCGSTLLYDPTGTVETPSGIDRVGWSPVNASLEWDGALSMSDALVRARRIGRQLTTGSGGEDHWTERASALLAPLLHAAALAEQPMATALSWVDRHDGVPALEILAAHWGEEHPAVNVLEGLLATDSREQSGIWSTASGALAAYRSSGALRSTTGPFLDPEAFCESANTLYICAPGRHQQLVAPMIVGLLTEIRDATYERANAGTRRPPVLLALDEVANIAPLPDLPSIVTEGAGQGLLTLACLQDLSQARARWGRDADAFLSIFGCSVILPGVADLPTLEAVSQLAGEIEMETRSLGRSGGWQVRLQRSLTVSTIFRRLLPVDMISQGRSGQALCLDARNRPGWVHLTPAHSTAPWNLTLDQEPSIPAKQRSMVLER